jgi:hypothetical protein
MLNGPNGSNYAQWPILNPPEQDAKKGREFIVLPVPDEDKT